MTDCTRRTFLAVGSVGCAGLGGAALAGSEGIRVAGTGVPDSDYPTTSRDPARQFVGASHFNIARVEEMLAEDGGLAKSAWDWGFGDWETAIGAASHTGQVAIIELLIMHGARPGLFTLATLDRVDEVRGIIESVPAAGALEGPHSISLFSHASAGKADRVMEYLESAGLKRDDPFKTDPAAVDHLVGVYEWGEGEADRFDVSWSARWSCLTIERPGGISRNLIPLGGQRFSPAGARHVVMEFVVEGGRAERLLVPRGDGVLACARSVG